MEIKKSSIPSASIEQSSATEKASTRSETKTRNLGISSDSKDSWQNFVSETAKSGGAVDPNALVQYVLRESYLQTTEDLKFYADKVKLFNESKKVVGEHLNGLRDFDAKLKANFETLQPGQKSNVLEAVAAAVKESVKDTNEDKKYFLDRIGTMNKMSQAISEYTEKLVEKSNHLSAKEKDDDD